MTPRIQDVMRAVRAHFLIIEDGPRRFVVCDDRNDRLAVVFCTREAADHAIDRWIEILFAPVEPTCCRVASS